MPALGEVTILHFNDCYNVESQKDEPVGGAARFCSVLHSYRNLDPMILFSGDIFAPSIMSTFTKGEQMIPVLNSFGVHCAVFGNHDFDFGLDILTDFAERTTFPWLISNVLDNETGKPLANGCVTYCIERHGKKFGLIGLVEEEWLATLSTIDPEEVTYIDFVVQGRQLAKQLKENENADFVIALTHMRFPNDCTLAENVDEIDLILGGHDHVYDVKQVNGKYVIKSGSDFRQLSKITLNFSLDEVDISVEELNVTSAYEEDPVLLTELIKYQGIMEGKMDEILGEFSVELDGRFSSIRTSETNLGNFVCDVMLSATHSDVALLNAGTLRSDRIHAQGPFTMRDLVTILPMMDALTVIDVTGEQLHQALENGVSQYPKLEGRFPQVSGIRFAFDPSKPAGKRVDPKYVKIGDDYLDLQQIYRMVTKAYLWLGKDGYSALKNGIVRLSDEEAPELCTIIQNHFHAIKIMTGSLGHQTRHRQSLISLSRRHSGIKLHEESMKQSQLCSRRKTLDSLLVDEVELIQCKLEPKVEGRIIKLDEEIIAQLEKEKDDFCNCLCRSIEELDEIS